jgi:hypothetical protein
MLAEYSASDIRNLHLQLLVKSLGFKLDVHSFRCPNPGDVGSISARGIDVCRVISCYSLQVMQMRCADPSREESFQSS